MPKMHQNTLTRSPRPPSRDGGGVTSKGRREGRREETTAVSVRTKLTLFSLRSNLDLIDDVTVGYVVCWQYPVGLAWLRGPLLVSQAAQDSAAKTPRSAAEILPGKGTRHVHLNCIILSY